MTEQTIRADAVRVGDRTPSPAEAPGSSPVVPVWEAVAEVQHGYRTPANLPAVVLVLEQSGRVIYPAAAPVEVLPGVTVSPLEWHELADAALAGAYRAEEEAERLDREEASDAPDPAAVHADADRLRRNAVEIRATVATIAERVNR
jgi:hypothetical protein